MKRDNFHSRIYAKICVIFAGGMLNHSRHTPKSFPWDSAVEIASWRVDVLL